MEFKTGSNSFGQAEACKTSVLHSPKDGVPILKTKATSASVIQLLEKQLGLRSWMENI